MKFSMIKFLQTILVACILLSAQFPYSALSQCTGSQRILNFDGRGHTSMNQENIVFCPVGSFTRDVLHTRNNLALYKEGNLTVNRIKSRAANLCFMSQNRYATGVIRTSTG